MYMKVSCTYVMFLYSFRSILNVSLDIRSVEHTHAHTHVRTHIVIQLFLIQGPILINVLNKL